MLTQEQIRNAVARVGKRYGIRKAYLFGSYAKGEANENSDVDILIDRGAMKGLIALSGFRLDLAEELGTEVDVLTTGAVRPAFFEVIKNDRVLLYGA